MLHGEPLRHKLWWRTPANVAEVIEGSQMQGRDEHVCDGRSNGLSVGRIVYGILEPQCRVALSDEPAGSSIAMNLIDQHDAAKQCYVFDFKPRFLDARLTPCS